MFSLNTTLFFLKISIVLAGLSDICVCEITLAPPTILPFLEIETAIDDMYGKLKRLLPCQLARRCHIWSSGESIFGAHALVKGIYMDPLHCKSTKMPHQHNAELVPYTKRDRKIISWQKNCQKGKHVFSKLVVALLKVFMKQCRRKISWNINFSAEFSHWKKSQFVANFTSHRASPCF